MNTRHIPLRHNALTILILTVLLASACVPRASAALRSVAYNPETASEPVLQDPTFVPLAPTAAGDPDNVSPEARSTGSTPAPLRFALPTPGDIPVSLWRPPLYKIPWAMGPFDHFYFSRPIAADEVNWPLADYRYGGIFPNTDIVHTGVDIDAPKGTPVLAAADGTIVWAGYGLLRGNNDRNDPYGQAVSIRHNFGWQGQRMITIYAHMDRIDVSVGQEVKAGEQIGLVGETGNVTGPHLHFEVRIKNNAYYNTYNPELWLAPPQGWGVLVGHLENTNGSLLTTQDVSVRSKATGRTWVVRSYGPKGVNGDPYYDENMALSDLPAGDYTVVIDYLDHRYQTMVSIHPGAITYFSFQGAKGFDFTPPPDPTEEEAPK